MNIFALRKKHNVENDIIDLWFNNLALSGYISELENIIYNKSKSIRELVMRLREIVMIVKHSPDAKNKIELVKQHLQYAMSFYEPELMLKLIACDLESIAQWAELEAKDWDY